MKIQLILFNIQIIRYSKSVGSIIVRICFTKTFSKNKLVSRNYCLGFWVYKKLYQDKGPQICRKSALTTFDPGLRTPPRDDVSNFSPSGSGGASFVHRFLYIFLFHFRSPNFSHNFIFITKEVMDGIIYTWLSLQELICNWNIFSSLEAVLKAVFWKS